MNSVNPHTVIGTVLESKQKHFETYKTGVENAMKINSFEGAQVKFGVNVTDIKTLESLPKATEIVFNFPHIPGKANVKYNRELVKHIFCNCRLFLEENGSLCLSLLKGQSGVFAESKIEWKASWLVQLHALCNGLYLKTVEDFELNYNLSSYRGRDMAFNLGDEPRKYTFARVEDYQGGKGDCGDNEDDFRLCYFHELHLRLNDNDSVPNIDEITQMARKAVRLVVSKCGDDDVLPITVETSFVADLRWNKNSNQNPAGSVVIYEICYLSLYLHRSTANAIRSALECEVIGKNNLFKLYEKKNGLLVSNAVPERMYRKRELYKVKQK